MYSAAKDRAGPIAVVAGILLVLTGCNSFGTGKQLQQLELENNRLLSEFRAERQRRESAERAAQQLENKLAESEKMLARQMQGPLGPGRLSSLPLQPTPPNLPDTSTYSGSGSASNNGLAPGTPDLRWHRRN